MGLPLLAFEAGVMTGIALLWLVERDSLSAGERLIGMTVERDTLAYQNAELHAENEYFRERILEQTK